MKLGFRIYNPGRINDKRQGPKLGNNIGMYPSLRQVLNGNVLVKRKSRKKRLNIDQQ